MNALVTGIRSRVLATIALAAVGCGGSTAPVVIPPSGSLVLYEGLPHPGSEPESFRAEKESRPTIEIHGDRFYKEPLSPNDADRASLREILGAPSTYEAFSGEKKCGGFHPDYAVEWSDAGKTHSALICFGCGEVKIFGPAGESRYDVPERARERLRTLLDPYAKYRPRPRSGSPLNPPPPPRA